MEKIEKKKINVLAIAIFVVIIFNATFNLSTFPAYYWDQGAYIDRAIVFLDNFHVYENPYYIDHPPLGWIILAGFFWPIDFPDSLVNFSESSTQNDIESQLLFLTLIPRLVIVFFTLIIAVLVYKISYILYDHKGFALVSLTSFAIIPVMWPFRNFLLDPIMIMFVLLSVYVLFQNSSHVKNFNSSNVISSKKFTKIISSGFLFGIALLVKFSAIFFFPFVLLFAMGYGLKWIYLKQVSEKKSKHENNTIKISRNQKISYGIIWMLPMLATLATWIIYLEQTGSLEYLISTQLWQVNRASSSLFESLLFLTAVSPIGFVFGVMGLSWIIKNKNQRIWSLISLPYIGFLFRGGYVSFVHSIPLIPVWSIFAGKYGYITLDKLVKFLTPLSRQNERNIRKFKIYLLLVMLSGSIGATVWISSFDDTQSSRKTIQWIIDNVPENSILVSDKGYSWLIKEFRPDITILDVYSLNYLDEIPDEFYFAEKSNPILFDQSLKQTQEWYEKSCLVTVFKNDPNSLGFFHPYSLISENWWNIEIRYFDVKGCN